ncbi:hypothetical protein CLCR_01000 [Cladophialophora carrionii]|uniref:Uncharacterized protein n=1 Tax=Cladophialophora carrionii TaxID=86049 RepID=A0A1C1D134_9EURO|nr:hypothetical protein CLCR_01000 [Cladophialophora carrionii]
MALLSGEREGSAAHSCGKPAATQEDNTQGPLARSAKHEIAEATRAQKPAKINIDPNRGDSGKPASVIRAPDGDPPMAVARKDAENGGRRTRCELLSAIHDALNL